jgi:hypothetical protein
MRRFVTLKMTDPVAVAATKAGFSHATGYRLKASSTLPLQKKAPAPLRSAWTRLERFSRPKCCHF